MKGILFSEPLFPLVVNGTKTQTRRIVNHSPIGLYYHSDLQLCSLWDNEKKRYKEFKPRYKVGETVYLKEPYMPGCYTTYYKYLNPEIDIYMNKNGFKWTNKLFMPESAARYFIEITGVRVEKLQDISEEDCIKEGITKSEYCFHAPGIINSYLTGKDAYSALINNINGKRTWDSNPYVWVYDFKMLEGRP